MTYTVFTGDGNCILTISTCDTYLTIVAVLTSYASRASNGYAIFAISAIFVNFDGISNEVFVQFNINCCVTSCIILFDESLNVFATVICVCFIAFTFYKNSGTKFISLNATNVSIEFKAFVDQSIGTVFNFVS